MHVILRPFLRSKFILRPFVPNLFCGLSFQIYFAAFRSKFILRPLVPNLFCGLFFVPNNSNENQFGNKRMRNKKEYSKINLDENRA